MVIKCDVLVIGAGTAGMYLGWLNQKTIVIAGPITTVLMIPLIFIFLDMKIKFPWS